jgi:hypothetical protein
MGAGIATILTYILRENEKLSSSTCIAFGPGTAFLLQQTIALALGNIYPLLKFHIGIIP